MYLLMFVFIFKCLVLLTFPSLAISFTFTYPPPTSCDNLNISWSGGNGPFSLLITPFFYVPQNISIPDSAYDESTGSGSFLLQLELPPGRKFLLTMSDSQGFESGGTSDILTVGSSISNDNCNLTEPIPDFLFQANSALQQCRTFTFSDYYDAVQPVRILGLIPLGQHFELDPPKSSSASFDWIANVANGTSITFILTDSKGRQGGSSDLRTVGISDDSSCIDASSPSSTASSTQTGAVASATETVKVNNGNNTAAIVGGVVGGLALFPVIFLLCFCCLRRRRQGTNDADVPHPPMTMIGRNYSGPSTYSRVYSTLFSAATRMRADSPIDLLSSSRLTRPSPSRQGSNTIADDLIPTPYNLPSEVSAVDGHSTNRPSSAYVRDHQRRHQSTSPPLPYLNYPQSPTTVTSGNEQSYSPTRSDAYMLSNPHSPRSSNSHSQSRRTRLILHTDLEDVHSRDDDGSSVLELPPEYSDRRPPTLIAEARKQG